MKRKNLILSALLIIQLLLIVILFTAKLQVNAVFSSDQKLLNLQQTEFDTIAITAPGEPKLLLSKTDQQWTVPDYHDVKANQNKVNDMITKLLAINESWPVAKTESAAPRFKVASDKFERSISFIKQGENVKTLYLGSSPGIKKVHARVHGQDRIFSIDFSTFEISTQGKDWMDRNLLKLDGDELIGIDPDDVDGGPTSLKSGMSCMDCHDPHVTVVYDDISGDGPGIIKSCEECHPGNVITSGGMTGLDCTDCHMPLLAKSAVAHDPVGTGPATGDIMSHIFQIDLTATDQFTADGKFAYPWITSPWACKTCHNGVDSFDLTEEVIAGMTIHGD